MIYDIRPASRSQAKPLIGLYAESGKGKTYSALLLARGFVGPQGKIVMIETEGGRGEAFSDAEEYPEIGGYDVLSIRETFSPSEYGNALTKAEQYKPDALIIDSASHEWEGAGGVLSMAAENQVAGKKGPLVWQKPKLDHQRHFMLRLMQTPIPLVIVCMRAKYPMKEIRSPNGKKEWSRSEQLEPKQADDILFEMFLHGWIDDEHRLHVTKYTTRSLESVFLDGERISPETGQRLAVWTHGGTTENGSSLRVRADEAAKQGVEPFRAFWKGLATADRNTLKPSLKTFQATAENADNEDPLDFSDDHAEGEPTDAATKPQGEEVDQAGEQTVSGATEAPADDDAKTSEALEGLLRNIEEFEDAGELTRWCGGDKMQEGIVKLTAPEQKKLDVAFKARMRKLLEG